MAKGTLQVSLYKRGNRVRFREKKTREPGVGMRHWRWRKEPHTKECSLASRSLKRQRNVLSCDASRMNTALITPQSWNSDPQNSNTNKYIRVVLSHNICGTLPYESKTITLFLSSVLLKTTVLAFSQVVVYSTRFNDSLIPSLHLPNIYWAPAMHQELDNVSKMAFPCMYPCHSFHLYALSIICQGKSVLRTNSSGFGSLSLFHFGTLKLTNDKFSPPQAAYCPLVNPWTHSAKWTCFLWGRRPFTFRAQVQITKGQEQTILAIGIFLNMLARNVLSILLVYNSLENKDSVTRVSFSVPDTRQVLKKRADWTKLQASTHRG